MRVVAKLRNKIPLFYRRCGWLIPYQRGRYLAALQDVVDVTVLRGLSAAPLTGPAAKPLAIRQAFAPGFRPVDDMNDTVGAASPGLFHAHVPFDEPPEMIERSAPGKLVRFNRWKTGPSRG